MEQENRAGCILHGCGVLAALAGLCAASGAACVFALTPGWRVWALPVFSCWRWQAQPAALLLYAAGSALQILCDIRPGGLGRDGTARARKKTPSICFLRSFAEPDRLLTLASIPSNKKRPHWPEGPCRALFFSFFIAKPARA